MLLWPAVEKVTQSSSFVSIHNRRVLFRSLPIGVCVGSATDLRDPYDTVRLVLRLSLLEPRAVAAATGLLVPATTARLHRVRTREKSE